MNFEHKQTGEVMKWFGEISKIPHESKCEGKLRDWILSWSKENNFGSKTDNAGNVVINIPATSGYENSNPVVLQGHMDMVCEKTPESTHDFTKDPIKLKYEGDWLTADGTSLGSDNGIAIAIAMAIALDKDASHPPLEILLTVDEETGLTGANALEKGLLKGKSLINIDSEKDGYFTVGCAGGVTSKINLPIELEKVSQGCKCLKIIAAGMKGGHSGLDINAEKANAIQVIGRTLNKLIATMDVRICDIRGGSAHNAIPRDSSVCICVNDSALDDVKKVVSEFNTVVKNEFKKTEPNMNLSVDLNSLCANDKVLTTNSTKKLVNLIIAMPHGVGAMSVDIKDLVETSNNFASIAIKGDKVEIITSQRSSLASRLEMQTKKIESLANLAGATMKNADGYPAWSPNMDSPLLKKSVSVYESLFKKKPVIEAIHAGLECGLIGDKYPGMDMLSIGPTIEQPHSPNERVNVKTVGNVYDFLKGLLRDMK